MDMRGEVYLEKYDFLHLDQVMTAEKLRRTTYAKAGDELIKVRLKSGEDDLFRREKQVEQGTVIKDYGYYLLLKDQRGMIFTIHKTEFLMKEFYEIKKVPRLCSAYNENRKPSDVTAEGGTETAF